MFLGKLTAALMHSQGICGHMSRWQSSHRCSSTPHSTVFPAQLKLCMYVCRRMFVFRLCIAYTVEIPEHALGNCVRRITHIFGVERMRLRSIFLIISPLEISKKATLTPSEQAGGNAKGVISLTELSGTNRIGCQGLTCSTMGHRRSYPHFDSSCGCQLNHGSWNGQSVALNYSIRFAWSLRTLGSFFCWKKLSNSVA